MTYSKAITPQGDIKGNSCFALLHSCSPHLGTPPPLRVKKLKLKHDHEESGNHGHRHNHRTGNCDHL